VFKALYNKVKKHLRPCGVDVQFPGSDVVALLSGMTDAKRTERMNDLDLWMRAVTTNAMLLTIPAAADAVLEVLEVEARVSE